MSVSPSGWSDSVSSGTSPESKETSSLHQRRAVENAFSRISLEQKIYWACLLIRSCVWVSG